MIRMPHRSLLKGIPMVISDAETLIKMYVIRDARFGSGLTTGALKSDHLSSGVRNPLSKASQVLLNSIGKCPSLTGDAMLLAYEWNPKCFRWPWHALWQACETYCCQCELIWQVGGWRAFWWSYHCQLKFASSIILLIVNANPKFPGLKRILRQPPEAVMCTWPGSCTQFHC